VIDIHRPRPLPIAWARRLGHMILASVRDSPPGQGHIAQLRHWYRPRNPLPRGRHGGLRGRRPAYPALECPPGIIAISAVKGTGTETRFNALGR
jgi:hypothetical protein